MSPAESILRECFRCFGRHLSNATLIDDGEVFGVMTEIPLTFFSGIGSADVRGDVAPVVERFREKRVPFRWWITPSTRPADLPERLEREGMRYVYDSGGMVAEMKHAPLDKPLPDGLEIRRIRDVESLSDWSDVLLPVFNLQPSDAALWRTAFSQIGFHDDAEWAHFVGYAGGLPVATTSVMMAGDLVGVYHVATLPSARGRGFGAALTLAGMRHGRERGATTAVLQSSPMGEPVYRALGFERVCRLSMYDWRP